MIEALKYRNRAVSIQCLGKVRGRCLQEPNSLARIEIDLIGLSYIKRT